MCTHSQWHNGIKECLAIQLTLFNGGRLFLLLLLLLHDVLFVCQTVASGVYLRRFITLSFPFFIEPLINDHRAVCRGNTKIHSIIILSVFVAFVWEKSIRCGHIISIDFIYLFIIIMLIEIEIELFVLL